MSIVRDEIPTSQVVSYRSWRNGRLSNNINFTVELAHHLPYISYRYKKNIEKLICKKFGLNVHTKICLKNVPCSC